MRCESKSGRARSRHVTSAAPNPGLMCRCDSGVRLRPLQHDKGYPYEKNDKMMSGLPTAVAAGMLDPMLAYRAKRDRERRT